MVFKVSASLIIPSLYISDIFFAPRADGYILSIHSYVDIIKSDLSFEKAWSKFKEKYQDIQSLMARALIYVFGSGCDCS